MIREHERDTSVMLECTNCYRTWVIYRPTDRKLQQSSDYHFKSCPGSEPEPNPKQPRMYNLPTLPPKTRGRLFW